MSGFVSAQQQKRKGKAFSTKSNINNGKAEDEKATKKYNNKEPRPEALKGAEERVEYMQTNEAQYTITAPEKSKNSKQLRKKKSQKQNKVTDNETYNKRYNIKGARPEIKKSVNKDAVPLKKGSNEDGQGTFEGNKQQHEKISATEYGTAITHPVPIRSQGGGGEESTHEGNFIQKDRMAGNEFDNSLVHPVKPRHTKASLGEKSKEIGSSGDIIQDRHKDYSKIHSTIPERISKIDNSKAIRIQKSVEAASSQGDVPFLIAFRRSFTESENGIANANYQGEIDSDVLTNRNARRKASNHQISSNTGDIVGVYEKIKQTEKDKALQVKEYRGKIDYDVLADRNALRKQKSEEIAKNTGDIIGTYADMRNRMRVNNKRIINYSGKIDYSVLKEQKSKMHALSKELKAYQGDITSKSLAAKRNGLRTRSRKATWYEGDMIVTARTRSNHPSAAYSVSKNSKSMSAKEKLRKRAIKKIRRHRDREDPDYMKKDLPRPRYETREYEIWESKTREGDIGTLPQK